MHYYDRDILRKVLSDDNKKGFWDTGIVYESVVCLIIGLIVGFVLGLIYCW